ncbi:MAG TPA: CPBP family intramembrane glutamic endopeptidase [Gemmatimonadales bacterium]
MRHLLRRLDGTLRAGTRLGMFLLVFAAGAALLAGLFYLVHFPQQKIHGVVQPLPMLGTGIGIIAVSLGATWLCLYFIEHRSFDFIALAGGGAWRRAVPIGLALGMIVPIVVAVVLRGTGHATIEASGLSSSDVLRQTLPMLGASVLLSSWEEIVYRGYPFRLLNEMGGVWFGTMLTGVAFGLSHSGNPGANPIGLANTALNGVLLGWIVLRTGSLWLACGYHAGWNIAATELVGMTDSGVRSLGSVFTTTLSGPGWLSGGDYGFEGSVLTGVGETIVLTLVLILASRRLARV